MPYLLALVIVVIVVTLAARGLVASVTVFEYQRGLRFVRGTLRNELPAGRHRYLRSTTTIRVFDLRSTPIAINGQEVFSKDGVAIKVSLSVGYAVINPRAAVMTVADYAATLYAELQQALRSAVSAQDVDALLANRAEVAPQILAQSLPVAERPGLRLEQVAIRDLTFPGELKKLYTQVAKAR